MKKYFILSLVCVLVSCGIQSDNEGQDGKTGLALPEPSIAGKTIRFKLTELAVVEEKFFTINDDILFDNSKFSTLKQAKLDDVELKIKTHCLFDEEQIVTEEFHRKMTFSIPLIEILPSAIFFNPEERSLSCSFSFTAESESRGVHHFELPHLPILNFENKHLVDLIGPFGRLTKQSPLLLSYRKMDYFLDTNILTAVDSLKLVCRDFSLLKPLYTREQFIPFSVFPFHEIKPEVLDTIEQKQPIQKCRVLVYRKGVLIGVSLTFRMVYPFGTPSIAYKSGVTGTYFVKQIKESPSKKYREPFYSYEIHNENSHLVYLLINHSSEQKPVFHLGGFYLSEGGGSFYKRFSLSYHLAEIISEKKEDVLFQKQTSNGWIIALRPGGKISIPVISNDSLESKFCSKAQWLAGAIEPPELKIYQLPYYEESWAGENENFHQSVQATNGVHDLSKQKMFLSQNEATLLREKRGAEYLVFLGGRLQSKKTKNILPYGLFFQATNDCGAHLKPLMVRIYVIPAGIQNTRVQWLKTLDGKQLDHTQKLLRNQLK